MAIEYDVFTKLEVDELEQVITKIKAVIPEAENAFTFNEAYECNIHEPEEEVYDLNFSPKSRLAIRWKKTGNIRDIEYITAVLYFLIGRLNVVVVFVEGNNECDFFGEKEPSHKRNNVDVLISKFHKEFINRIPVDHPWHAINEKKAKED